MTGQFLIAMPKVQGDAFERAVIYVCDHTSDGALGLMINRTSSVTISDVLQRMQEDDDGVHINAPLPKRTEQSVKFAGAVTWEAQHFATDSLVR